MRRRPRNLSAEPKPLIRWISDEYGGCWFCQQPGGGPFGFGATQVEAFNQYRAMRHGRPPEQQARIDARRLARENRKLRTTLGLTALAFGSVSFLCIILLNMGPR